jgi:hypothetical protein
MTDKVSQPAAACAIPKAAVIAIASSINAAGASLPKEDASRLLSARPPKVPIAAPIAPAMPPIRSDPPAAPTAAPRERAAGETSPKLQRDCTAGSRWQLVGDQFPQRQEGEDPRRPGVTEEGKPCGLQRKPAQVRRPADRRRSCHSTHSGDHADANARREQIEVHSQVAPITVVSC